MACREPASSVGYQPLKEKQLDVITSFVKGKDVFAVLPKGFSKSLCYARLPGVFGGLYSPQGSIIAIILPLTAIIKDQISVQGYYECMYHRRLITHAHSYCVRAVALRNTAFQQHNSSLLITRGCGYTRQTSSNIIIKKNFCYNYEVRLTWKHSSLSFIVDILE